MSANRKDLRTQLAAILAQQVPAAQAVHDHEPGDIGGATPVLVISARGSNRSDMTFRGSRLGAKLWLDIYTLAAESSDGGYTYADSADVVDDLEAQIAAALERSQETAHWNRIDYDGESNLDFGVWDGQPYFRERIPLSIQVYG